MYPSDTEIIFPMRVTPHLRDLRGDAWRQLIDRVLNAPEASIDHLAFSLLVIRLSNCLTCHTYSYRALRGCTLCAKHAVLRFRGNDAELMTLFDRASADIDACLQNGTKLLETMQYITTAGDAS